MTTYYHDLADGKKFKNETIKLGKNAIDDEIVFENDINGQIAWSKSGNDVIITVYGITGAEVDTKKVLGKITIQNAGKKGMAYREEGDENYLTFQSEKNGSSEGSNLFAEGGHGALFFAWGDPFSEKNQTVTGTYLNESIHGGYGNDTLKSVGGNDILVGGKGSDKLYAGEGSTYFEFNALDADGSTDTIYNSTERDAIDTTLLNAQLLRKEGNNLVIDYAAEFGGGKNKVVVDKFWAQDADKRIGFLDDFHHNVTFGEAFEDYFDDGEKILVTGKEKSANTLAGTEYNDAIIGGNKADKITTGEGADVVVGLEGDDTIVLDGDGEKDIYIGKGHGNDVVSVDTEKADDVEANIYFQSIDEGGAHLSFAKNGQDLVITSDASEVTESVTLKNFYGVIPYLLPGDYSNVTINEDSVEAKIIEFQQSGETIKIGGTKLSDILKTTKIANLPYIGGGDSDATIADVLKEYGVNIPSGLKNANIYTGTPFNDSFVGSNNKDVMVSFGGVNDFTTGKKGQTVIASLNMGSAIPSATDAYNITSYEAGTAIFDMDGIYDLKINGVNTDDIHMLSAGLGYASGASGSDPTTEIDYMTDGKGIKTFANLDYKGIGDKVINIAADVSALNTGHNTAAETEKLQKDIIKNVNSLLTTADSAISNFRGVAMVKRNEYYGGYDDITVTDKKGNEHTIAAESQYILEELTEGSLNDYAEYVLDKYAVFTTYGDPTAGVIAKFVQFLAVPEIAAISKDDYDESLTSAQKSFYKWDKKAFDGEGGYVLTDKAYKEIKNGFFDTFQNLYIGTDGDNKYTIKDATLGASIVSGTGSDSFTLSGNLIDKPEYYSYIDEDGEEQIDYDYQMNRQQYNIVSDFNQNEAGKSSDKDTLTISNYSFDKKTLTAAPMYFDYDDESVSFEGIRFGALDYKKGAYADIDYMTDFDITNNKFNNLTVIDGSKKKFAVTAEYNDTETPLNYNWSSNKDNHIAGIISEASATVVSNKGTNIITADVDGLSYTYNGGNDVVYSTYEYSGDIYNVKFDKKTSLTIDDEGWEDEDRINITGTSASKLKLFFNVSLDEESEDGYTYDDFSLVSSDNLKKANLLLAKNGDESEMAVDKGISVSGEIDDIYIGGEYFGYDAAMNDIAEQVAGWLTGNGKYSDVAEVMNYGSNNEIKEVLAIYNRNDLADYTGIA